MLGVQQVLRLVKNIECSGKQTRLLSQHKLSLIKLTADSAQSSRAHLRALAEPGKEQLTGTASQLAVMQQRTVSVNSYASLRPICASFPRLSCLSYNFTCSWLHLALSRETYGSSALHQALTRMELERKSLSEKHHSS